MIISERIFRIMEEKKISQSELARRTGISTRTISDWRHKKTNPSADRIMAICGVLGVTPEELLAGEGRNADLPHADPESRNGRTAAAGPETEILEKRIAELEERLEEAKAANAAKETFLSNMSHDIRTPMNAIVGMTALAKKHIDEKKRVADALNKIETASSHLLSLINDVLDMSRIDSGRMKIAEEHFALSDLLHDVLTIIQPQMEQKNHVWEFRLGEITEEDLFGDALRLRQVYVNIINNAVKYTNTGGNILLSVSEEIADDRCLLRFTCTDNGIGMSEEFLKRIFEPFERAGSSTISRIEGTGLGMSIVKKIVEAMGGTIGITSREGEGTSVSVTVPLRYEKSGIDPGNLSEKNFLILEADEVPGNTYEGYFREFGIPHTVVRSAQEALEALTEAEFRGGHYDAVIIGRKIAGSGSIYDIASYIQTARPGIVIILMSSDNWNEIQYHANRCGIRYFIPFPVFRKSLISGLKAALAGEEGGEMTYDAPNLAGKKILLVEDNLINQEIAKEILSVTGAKIDTAEDGKEAVWQFERSEKYGYAMILMDVQMPVMDGYEATRRIRALEREDAASVPIFAMTANTFAEDIAKAREAGMNGHIAKPVDMGALMNALRQNIR